MTTRDFFSSYNIEEDLNNISNYLVSRLHIYPPHLFSITRMRIIRDLILSLPPGGCDPLEVTGELYRIVDGVVNYIPSDESELSYKRLMLYLISSQPDVRPTMGFPVDMSSGDLLDKFCDWFHIFSDYIDIPRCIYLKSVILSESIEYSVIVEYKTPLTDEECSIIGSLFRSTKYVYKDYIKDRDLNFIIYADSEN